MEHSGVGRVAFVQLPRSVHAVIAYRFIDLIAVEVDQRLGPVVGTYYRRGKAGVENGCGGGVSRQNDRVWRTVGETQHPELANAGDD